MCVTFSDGFNTTLSHIQRTQTSFFEHQTNSNVLMYWWSNIKTLFLALNDRTSNFEANRAFSRFTKLPIELTRASFSNIEQTQTCLSIDNQIGTPMFWLRTIEHRTSNIVRPVRPISSDIPMKKLFQCCSHLLFIYNFPMDNPVPLLSLRQTIDIE